MRRARPPIIGSALNLARASPPSTKTDIWPTKPLRNKPLVFQTAMSGTRDLARP